MGFSGESRAAQVNLGLFQEGEITQGTHIRDHTKKKTVIEEPDYNSGFDDNLVKTEHGAS